MLTKKQLNELKEELMNSKKPLIFFDDDTDGLCSFLLYYKFLKPYAENAKGIIVKSTPELKDDIFIQKAKEFQPDKIFVLDKPLIHQDFLDEIHKLNIPVIWLDHHPLSPRHHVKYFNPLQNKDKKIKIDNRPTTYWAYKTIENKKDMWIAMIGCVGDWFLPEFAKEFSKEYPDLLPKTLKIKNPGTVLFESELGKLCKIFQFNLKGSTKEALAAMKIFTRINDPYEILHQTTAQGKYIYQHYAKLNEVYNDIKSRVKITDDPLIVFEYEDRHSLTGDLANELMYYHPDKIIIIGRFKDGEMKCSLRAEKLNIRDILEKSLVGINGHGGGHEHACGACIKKEDFSKFLDNLRKNMR